MASVKYHIKFLPYFIIRISLATEFWYVDNAGWREHKIVSLSFYNDTDPNRKGNIYAIELTFLFFNLVIAW